MTFSPTHAAAAGFRLIRDRPLAVVGWGFLYLGVFALGAGLMLAVMMPVLQTLIQTPPGDTASMETVFGRMLGVMLPMMAIVLPLTLLIAAVMSCAVYRAVLRPSERGFASLRIGADEFRQMALLVILFVALMLIMAPFTFGLFFAVTAMGPESAFALVFPGALLLMCAYIFLLVRFSLAPAITFAERRISILKSWRLTAGRFWPMVGMFLLTFLFSLGIGLVAAVLGQSFLAMGANEYLYTLAPPGGGLPDLSRLPAPGVAAMIGFVGYAISNVVAGVLRLVVYYAAPATAYAQLTSDSPETTGEVFS